MSSNMSINFILRIIVIMNDLDFRFRAPMRIVQFLLGESSWTYYCLVIRMRSRTLASRVVCHQRDSKAAIHALKRVKHRLAFLLSVICITFYRFLICDLRNIKDICRYNIYYYARYIILLC